MQLLSTKRRTTLMVTALCGWALAASFLAGGVPPDEAWFLYIVHRLLQGDVPYRDFFLGVTPLSLYLTAAAAWFAGTEILVLRLLNAFCVAAITCLCAARARRAGAADRVIVLLAVAVPLFSDPRPDSLYSVFSVFFYLASGLPANPLAAGILAGLSFATKQNVGVFALLALFVTWALQGKLDWRRAVLSVAGFGGAAGSVLMPVMRSGGVGELIRYGFTGKTVYLQTAGASYDLWKHLDPLPLLAKYEVWHAIALWIPALRFALPLALLPLAWRVIRNRNTDGQPEPQHVSILVFGVLSLLFFYPRADDAHVRFGAPSLLLAAAAIARRVPRRRVLLPFGSLMLFSLAGGLAVSAHASLKGWLVEADLPHLLGVLMTPDEIIQWHQIVPLVQQASDQRGPMFLQTQAASFLYLAGEISSPTPFDYPIASAFGPRGQSEVISLFHTGHLQSTCFAKDFENGQNPVELSAFITTQLKPGADLGVCRVYVADGTRSQIR